MSNWKHAYGWSGHILVSSDQTDGNPDDNVIAVQPEIFEAILKAHNNCEIDERIQTKLLGVIESDTRFLACGCCFSDGFTHYGTIFLEAELRAERDTLAIDHDAEYRAAMKEIYGLDLPPCHLMVGCSSEH